MAEDASRPSRLRSRRARRRRGGPRSVERDYKVEVDGKLFDVKVIGEAAGAGGAGAAAAGAPAPPKRERKAAAAAASADSEALASPLQGTV